jgi:hypothetical protein
MKKLSLVLIASAFVLSVSSTPIHSSTGPAFDTCSCVAPDGSCSVSITCGGGCVRFCGNDDNCRAWCSGGHGFLEDEFSFEMENGTYPRLVDEIARVSGKELAFSPTKPNMIFNVGFKRATLWDALTLLSEQGTVRIDGQDFENLKRLRRSLLSGEKYSFCVKNTSINTFVSDINGLTGLPLRISSGSPKATINIKLENVTLSEILTAVSNQTGTEITQVSPARSDE